MIQSIIIGAVCWIVLSVISAAVWHAFLTISDTDGQ